MSYTLEQLKAKFEYDPITGNVFGLNWGRKQIPRKLLKSISDCGYYRVLLNLNGERKALLLHRVAYELHTNELLGTSIIDHIDQNKLNNKFSNLRKTSRADNNKNLPKRKDNISGESGVYQLPNGKWRAQIRVNNKNKHLGCYSTIEEAAQAKTSAKIQHGFHENHN